MRNLLIIVIITSQLTCSFNTVKITRPGNKPPSELEKLDNLFHLYEKDIYKATNVIIEKNIINSLTHLQKMATGGRKYYLLEKKSLTKMIDSVTEGMYTDFILINKKGDIIYTMNSKNDIFAKNVSSIKETPIHKCFTKKKMGDIFFKDSTNGSYMSNNANLYVSVPIMRGNSFMGLFIMKVDMDRIRDIFKNETVIIGYDGKYRISHNKNNILNPYPYFEMIDKTDIEKKNKGEFTYNNTNFLYSPFTFKNISWIVVTLHKDNL